MMRIRTEVPWMSDQPPGSGRDFMGTMLAAAIAVSLSLRWWKRTTVNSSLQI